MWLTRLPSGFFSVAVRASEVQYRYQVVSAFGPVVGPPWIAVGSAQLAAVWPSGRASAIGFVWEGARAGAGDATGPAGAAAAGSAGVASRTAAATAASRILPPLPL
ncbi:hypothetical protein GCM10025867_43480 [Frondihabitans sucicola]|uniref:Uncharacterized protein n=1 Tax=Frondihabitans sucicola TaxID=1268041 RepID=A0ABM8GUF3_9MICO|nr:hypothetical protein [Frondihabitans sucicola]BDZ52107.1 hypothetical protein GCM10025867_43480 [Frondihabitans sucicola]